MRAQFGNVTSADHPARMPITDPEDVFAALTSYPPGDRASEPERAAFVRPSPAHSPKVAACSTSDKEVALFLSRKEG